MRSIWNSNFVSMVLLGVFLLMASAVGRVAAGNMNAWLKGSHARIAAADRAEVAAVLPWRAR